MIWVNMTKGFGTLTDVKAMSLLFSGHLVSDFYYSDKTGDMADFKCYARLVSRNSSSRKRFSTVYRTTLGHSLLRNTEDLMLDNRINTLTIPPKHLDPKELLFRRMEYCALEELVQ